MMNVNLVRKRKRKRRSLYEEYLAFKRVERVSTSIQPSDILKSTWLKTLVFTLSLIGTTLALTIAPPEVFVPVCFILLALQVIMTKMRVYSISDGIAISMSIYTFPVLVIAFPYWLAYGVGYGYGIGTAVEKVGLNPPALMTLFLINLFSLWTFLYSLGYAFEAAVKYGSYIYIATFFSGLLHELGHYIIIPSYGIVIAFPYFMATIPVDTEIPTTILILGVFAGPLVNLLLTFVFDIIYDLTKWDFALITKRVNQFLVALNITPFPGSDGSILIDFALKGNLLALFLYLVWWVFLIFSVVI